MIRRVLTAALAATMIFALLPAASAAASGNASAELAIANQDVFPGSDNFSLTVTNDEASLIGLTGNSIDYVSIILPGNRGFRIGAADVAQDGWDVTVIDEGNSQELVYQGGEISPNSSETFDFPVDVLRPANRDVPGPFQVGVSTDGGNTVSSADESSDGALTSLVRILEIVDGDVTAPALAADGTASAGQSVTYTLGVRNYAQDAVDVTAELDGNGFTVDDAAPTTSAAGQDAVTDFDFGITFDSASSDRTQNLDAAASAINAEANGRTFDYLVQAPPQLRLVNPRETFDPRFIRDDIDYRFEVDMRSQGSPSATITGGDLSFADTVVGVDAGETETFPTGGGDRTVVTERVMPTGDEGDYPVTYELAVEDGNGYAFDQVVTSEPESIVTIDITDPIIRNLETILPTDDDGDRQIRAKDGDSITVRGEVEDRNADPEELTVLLDVLGGGELRAEPENIETTSTANGFEFEATVSGDFGVLQGAFRTVAKALDKAGNEGTADGDTIGIDNIPPELALQGFTISAPDVDSRPVIQVVFDENFDVKGGCNPRHYRVDGELLVRDVRYSDGSPCQSGEADPNGSNTRILRLLDEKPRDYETNVTYNPDATLANDRIKDGAGWYADQGVQEIIARVAPPLPELGDVLRNNGSEEAVFDEDAYWTRFGGNDLTADVVNVRNGERVQVLDENGTVINQTTASDSSGTTIAVPIGDAEGTYERSIRLVNVRGNAIGPAEDLTIELDQTAPALQFTERINDDEVRVDFDQVIWDGSNAAGNWRAFERDEFSGDDARMTVTEVRSGEEPNQRILEVDFQDWGPYSGAEYRKIVQDSTIYEDRAGNLTPEPQFISANIQ